jgi:iron complex outermembrane receptor protein
MEKIYIAFLLFVPGIAFAQQAAGDSTYFQVDSVIVTAGRNELPLYKIPFSVDIINQDQLNSQHGSLTAENIFNTIPGVIVDDRNNFSEGDRISMRGIGALSQFGVDGIKIILDGIPLTFADGTSELSNLDINSIGRIEVIRGPSSFLYGNASGGVISIESKGLNTAGLNLIPGYSLGSFGLQKYSFNASDRIGDNTLLINVNKMNYSGYRQNSAASTTGLNIISKQDLDSTASIEAVFNYFDSPYLLNPSSLTRSNEESDPSQASEFVKSQGSGKKISQGQAGINVSYVPGENQKLDAAFYVISRSMLNPMPGEVIKLIRAAGGFRTNYNYNFKLFNMSSSILAGADYEIQNDVRTEFANNGVSGYNNLAFDQIIDAVRLGATTLDQREIVYGTGVFGKFEFSPLENTFISLGLRYDKYNFSVYDRLFTDSINTSGSRLLSNVSRMAGINYRFTENLSLFANYSTAFQTPTTTQLSNSQTGVGGFNPSLQPELISNYEMGVRGYLAGSAILYNASVYRLYIDRILIPYQLAGSLSDVLYYRNTGNAINNGFELLLNWITGEKYNISLSYNLMDFKYTNFIEDFSVTNGTIPVQLDGKRVPGVPEDKLTTNFTYKIIYGLTAGVSLNWTGKYFVNDINGPVPGSDPIVSDYINNAYVTADVQLTYDHSFASGNLSVYLCIENLFNERYSGSIVPNASGDKYFEPGLPRNWYGGISFGFL